MRRPNRRDVDAAIYSWRFWIASAIRRDRGDGVARLWVTWTSPRA